MKKRAFTITIICLSTSTLVMANEYKDPKLEVKDISPSYKEMKAVNMEDQYKMEGPVKAIRQIASDDENSDRGPSSLADLNKKNAPEVKDEKEATDNSAPKQWLFKRERDN